MQNLKVNEPLSCALNPKISAMSYLQRKEQKTVKYESPELTALVPAIDAIATPGSKNPTAPTLDSSPTNDGAFGYQDWEE